MEFSPLPHDLLPFMARPFSAMNAGTDDTNDLQIEIAPADGTDAAAN